MKQRLILIVAALLFTLHLFPAVHAQAPDSTQSAQVEDVNYFLAYPGILPDSPFYFLKVIRDKVVGFLINDPLKKSEFNLLTSDKRVFAGQLLIERGEDELGVESISKGNNYFHEAVSDIAGEDDMTAPEIQNQAQKLHKAARKHLEVIKNSHNEIDPNYAQGLTSEEKRAEELTKFVESVFPQVD